MSDSKADVQTLVMHLLENPNDFESFQNNSQGILAKLKISGMSDGTVRQVITVIKENLLNKPHPDHANHSDRGIHTNTTGRTIDAKISQKIKIDMVTQIVEAVKISDIAKTTVIGKK